MKQKGNDPPKSKMSMHHYVKRVWLAFSITVLVINMSVVTPVGAKRGRMVGGNIKSANQ